jgi:hypothetical protein
MSLISSPLDFLSFDLLSVARRSLNDIFDPTFFNFVEIFGSNDICFVTAARPARLDVFGELENVLCRINGASESLFDLENAAANRLVRVDAFFDVFLTNARISRITLVFSFFSDFSDFSEGSSFAGDGSLGDGKRYGEIRPDSTDLGDNPQVSEGFEIVIGGIGS